MLKYFWVLIIFLLVYPFFLIAQDKPDIYISNQGKDNNPGTSTLLPRKTITATAPLLKGFSTLNGNVKVALRSGDLFPESLTTSYPIEVTTYPGQSGTNDFAVLDGTGEFNSGWEQKDNTVYTFGQRIPYTGFNATSIGDYSFMYVFEIDRELEKTAPVTARKLLVLAGSLEDLEKTPGSFYTWSTTNENPKPVFIHTTNGLSPNANQKYRYEVTVKDWGINSSLQKNNVFQNLWLRGYGGGYGMLQGGDNSKYNKIIFGPGAAIHHIVARGGAFDHSLFLPAAKNINRYSIVFYDVQGLGRHCSVKNSIFLDVRSPVYAHTSNGTYFGAVEMDNVIGFADTTQRDAFMSVSNTDSVMLNSIYAESYTAGYGYGRAKYVSVYNSYFKDVNAGIGFNSQDPVTAVINNVFIKTNGLSYAKCIDIEGNTDLRISHSILHIRATSSYAGSFIFGSGAARDKINASGNIFICDVLPSTTLFAAATNTEKGLATSGDKWDYNVYILLQGKNITWQATNGSTNKGILIIDNFEEWKKQSGQDKHSLFFDLREDSRALRAIFVDPDNGNYELANTPEGKQVAALGAGMTAPLTCFLKKPTYEAAVNLIRTNTGISVNTCRNPCQQNTLRVNSTLQALSAGTNKVLVNWTIAEQQNIDHYELQRAIGNSVFKKITNISIGPDSVYSFTDNVQLGTLYQYRLLVFAQAGNACYSDTKSIRIAYNNTNSFTIYPNPSTGKLWISLNGYLGKSTFTILNASGESLLSREFFSLYAPQLLDLGKQPKGIYFIKLETSNGVNVQRFVIE